MPYAPTGDGFLPPFFPPLSPNRTIRRTVIPIIKITIGGNPVETICVIRAELAIPAQSQCRPHYPRAARHYRVVIV
ncbi:MAG: hypothetical protein RL122_2072, partial [Pseudomonadota bacterium]